MVLCKMFDELETNGPFLNGFLGHFPLLAFCETRDPSISRDTLRDISDSLIMSAAHLYRALLPVISLDWRAEHKH